MLIVSIVLADDLSALERIVLRARNRIPKKGKRRKERLSEIKFSLTGDNTRRFVLKELRKRSVKIYSLVIDKEGRSITDNPTNYALIIGEAMKVPLSQHPHVTHVLIDRHFTYVTQREECNRQLQERFGNALFIEHVDSLQNPVITLADFVAGAVRVAHTKQDTQFTQCIEGVIRKEQKISWREIKKR